MRIVKTFESFFNEPIDHEMMPHQAQKMDMHQHPAAKVDQADHREIENYMLFGNLETIQRLTELMLKMDPRKVDQILKNGHSWAVDHIATSKDDIEEVANFLIGEMNENINEGKYKCNECGTSYEAAVINEGDVCECGGSLNKE